MSAQQRGMFDHVVQGWSPHLQQSSITADYDFLSLMNDEESIMQGARRHKLTQHTKLTRKVRKGLSRLRTTRAGSPRCGGAGGGRALAPIYENLRAAPGYDIDDTLCRLEREIYAYVLNSSREKKKAKGQPLLLCDTTWDEQIEHKRKRNRDIGQRNREYRNEGLTMLAVGAVNQSTTVPTVSVSRSERVRERAEELRAAGLRAAKRRRVGVGDVTLAIDVLCITGSPSRRRQVQGRGKGQGQGRPGTAGGRARKVPGGCASVSADLGDCDCDWVELTRGLSLNSPLARKR
jgi:hypothetical protein